MLSRASQIHHHLPIPCIVLSSSSSQARSSTLKLSLTSLTNTIPYFSISSSLTPHHLKFQNFNSCTTNSFSTSTNIHNFSRIPSSLIGLHSLSSCFLSNPTMIGRPSHRGQASFSTGSNSSEGSREILVQHLLVKEDDLNLLIELQKRVAGGEDLSDLAVEYSLCPSKEEGGMLGWVRKGQMVPEFEEAAFSAPLNTVVRCKTKFGWHLLQVLSEREELVLQEIQANELHEKLQDPDFIEKAQLIDVREPDEVAKASLPGFQVLPLQQFASWGPEITTKFDTDKDTYVLCHHGVRSMQVSKWLQMQGFKKVFNVAGGIHAYALNADPSIPTY